MNKPNHSPHMVRLLDESGKQIGIVSLEEAKLLATAKGLEIAFLNNNTEPAVVQIADLGRIKYTRAKNDKNARKKQHRIMVKELKLRYTIASHDYLVKLASARAFLKDGANVKLLVQMRGREVRHSQLAVDLCNRFIIDLAACTVCQGGPKVEGRAVVAMLERSN